MLNLILQLSISAEIATWIGVLGGFTLVSTLLWNSARKNTSLELTVKSLQSKHDEDILNLSEKFNKEINAVKEKHNEYMSMVREKVTENQAVLTKELTESELSKQKEISNLAKDRKDDLTMLATQIGNLKHDVQKQLDSSKSDLKDALSKITVLATKADYTDQSVKELSCMIQSEKRFFTNWNQRLEDRITRLNTQILDLLKMISNLLSRKTDKC